jgi:hypothetical protein
VGYSALNYSQEQIDVARERLPWNELFFEGGFGTPLTVGNSGSYAEPLEMVRIAPSASNKQPWRIVRQDSRWHFFIQRTKNYRELALSRFTGIADMQRIDLGIAMAHFETAAAEAGLVGTWQISDPGLPLPGNLTEYAVTWVPFEN